MSRTRNAIAIALCGVLALTGCASQSRMAKGGAIGAAAGGVLGAVIGSRTDHTAAGAIIGAAVGGIAGAAIGRYMDKQAAELERDLENARVERIGEGIKITFNSGILFDVDSDRLRPEAQKNIADLGRILQKYDDTNVLIEGHTDNTGSDQHNQGLSERRANSVSNYVKGIGVSGFRLTTAGYGEMQPVADNNDPSGRQANRRVEIAIFANEELKRAAADGKI